ncbi:MAG: hypothetical protein QNK37_20165 [Acidobacteriota bacterium]|nr:hypothetical protein [Acidobacteriota bacterium]
MDFAHEGVMPILEAVTKVFNRSFASALFEVGKGLFHHVLEIGLNGKFFQALIGKGDIHTGRPVALVILIEKLPGNDRKPDVIGAVPVVTGGEHLLEKILEDLSLFDFEQKMTRICVLKITTENKTLDIPPLILL